MKNYPNHEILPFSCRLCMHFLVIFRLPNFLCPGIANDEAYLCDLFFVCSSITNVMSAWCLKSVNGDQKKACSLGYGIKGAIAVSVPLIFGILCLAVLN